MNLSNAPNLVSSHSQDVTPARLRIGITIGLGHPKETLWNNGIKQNAVFLADALKNCSNVSSVVLVNTTDVPITSGLPWDLEIWPTKSFVEAKDQIDVLIELGGQINAEQTAYIKDRGVRLISYCCGFEYIHMMEAVLFSRDMGGGNLFINQRYDDIWMIPQVANCSRAYFEVFRRHEARVVPFVWSPVFLLQKTAAMPFEGIWQQPDSCKGWRLSIMEPNIDVVKFCLYPILIAEMAYRSEPEAISILQVCNTLPMAQKSMEFIALMNQLDIVKNHKSVFLGRYDTPTFLATNTDAVISHQWENPLNYFYLEVCWQGYPLIHNAELISDLGYYYAGNDVQAGAKQLLAVMSNHAYNAAQYMYDQRQQIARFLPNNSDLVASYSALLAEVVARPLR
ncbi:MAG: DUF2827 domain-containing protein [Snodgrassella sp.]|uniref:DUF2827 domain-containing protein n=1 Tax=Snodgrassella sp. TaxID=2815304 RepID=UPI00258F2008|nr:DUF2827 domain-containing protein [Snodgrassella sp.]MCO6507937.1 DUF2827 domain-containing protein [Snodgrassella sp.]